MELYQRNAGAQTTTPGLSLVHKLRYEHIHLTSFSKMQVDLAVQVFYMHIIWYRSYCILGVQVLSKSVSKVIKL